MVSENRFRKGLGQLKAYLDVDEGVAFQMDNGMYWCSMGPHRVSCIQGVSEKSEACKFHISCLPSGKITMKNWKGLGLAAVDVPSEVFFPIQPVEFTDNENQEYDVFYKDNKVTFKAYNGLFLGRRCNKLNTLTAVRFYPDDTCYFRPVIGDVLPPSMEILGAVLCNVPEVPCVSYILAEQSYVNRSEVPVTHTFTMTWETLSIDRIIWTHMWGLGLISTCNFMILDMKASLFYSQDNEEVITALRIISEYLTEEVKVPPKKEAKACFCVDKQNFVPLSFIAIVRKTKPDQDVIFHIVGGSWMGLIYTNLRVEVEFVDI